ncbi:hypothetical protein FI667_g4271, partial [Globisporangium splendens]
MHFHKVDPLWFISLKSSSPSKSGDRFLWHKPSISGFTPSTSTGTTVDPSPSENLDPADPRPSENVFALLATDPVSCDHSPVTDPAVGTSTDSEEKVDETMDPAVHASGSNDDGSGDVPMLPPSADSTGAGSHAGNSVPTPPAPSSPATDTRLSMADILRLQEDIRRDRAVVDASRRRVETPKPLAVDIEAIERQYAAGGDWSNIASRLEQARPYQLPRAKYDMVIETGRALAKTPVQKILASLASSGHGNAALEELYKRFEIGQISKLPGGNLRVKVKSKDACVRLERTKVNILGGVFTFKEFDILGDKYYLDISNVDSDTNTDLILERLFILGCKPMYDTFREVNLATGVTSATWRVYFLSSSCPSALIINSGVCDQVIFDNKLHPAHGKNAPFRSERLPFGYRSTQALELGVPGGVFPFPGSLSEPTLRSQKPNQHGSEKSYAQAAAATPKQPSPPSATKGQVNGDSQPQRGAQHGQISGLIVPRKPGSTASGLSVGTFNGSTGKITPPASPRVGPQKPLLLTNGDSDGFQPVTKKSNKKRSRNGADFANMVAKQQPQPLDGIATSNYFDVLQSVEAAFEAKKVTADKKYGIRYQVLPTEVKRPEALKESKESAFFIEKHHTKVRKSPKASHIVEVAESMANDENTALLSVLPDRLTHADTKVDAACKIVANATNADHVTKHAVENPLAFNSALSLKMAGTGHEMQELAQLHMINRVLSASDPIRELSRATKALSLFELMLMSIAPTIFANDHWIQYLTGMPVPWIPAHHTRLLHPNTLLMLLRSELGALCMKQWAEVQWQGRILEDLEALRDLEDYYPDDASVLKLRVVDGSVVMPSWNNISALTVNTNGIKDNGHLFIDNMVSKHSISCVQETKFSDKQHLSTFKFHLDSSFKHQVFVNDRTPSWIVWLRHVGLVASPVSQAGTITQYLINLSEQFTFHSAMKRPSDQVNREERPSSKRQRTAPELFDISPILKKKGDLEFYKEQFFTQRDSWRTFVRLENENKMERLLRRGNARAERRSPADDRANPSSGRRSVAPGDATSSSHSCGSRREHQTPMSDEAPTCPSSVDIHATELCRSVDGSTASFLDDEPVDLHDQQSAQPPSDALPESLTTGVGLNEKTIDRLWKWKSAHRGQIEALQQRCSTLEEHCESLENLVADHESKIDVLTEGSAQCSALESRYEERFQQVQDELVRLQKNEKSRELAHDRLLRSVEEAGSALEVLRGEYHSRLQALEAVKDQSFDVLQLLYAEKNLQSDELFALRNHVEKLHDQLDRLRKIS